MSMSRTLALGAACLLAGCADFRAYCDAQLIASRNGYLARTAWHERGGALCEGCKHQSDFQDGFYEGYLSVATGMGGVAPLVPPEKYWAACYQDAEGHEIINDWFGGFNEGAFAAAQDGIGELAEIPTWMGGACCDEQGRLLARPEPPAPRKPRRGDPPVRAKLPPSLPRADKPMNSAGDVDAPIDPNKVETPPPSEPETDALMPLTPDVLEEKDVPNEKSAPKIDAKKKIKTASRSVKSKSVAAPRRESKTDADRWAKRVPARREPPVKSTANKVMPWTPASSPIPQVDKTKSNEIGASLPVNPFVRSKANQTPTFPVAPPVLPSAGLKPSSLIEQETPKPAKVIERNDLEPPPPPPRASFGDLRGTASIAVTAPTPPKPTPETIAPRPPIETVSHSEKMKPSAPPRPAAALPHAVKPAEQTPAPLSKDVEDGWGTPHDNRAADLAGRRKE